MKQILFRPTTLNKLRRINKKVATWLLCSFVVNTVGSMGLYASDSRMQMKMAQTAVAHRSGYVDVSPQNIAGMDLKQVMCDIVMKAQSEGMLDQLPQGIIRCYESLQTSMYVHRADLEEAMPFIIRSLVPADMIDESGNVRAMRPTDAQGAPIVGAATCDLTPVLKAISCLRALIIREFNETWTILANLEQELLECCSQIHAEFNATWTILNQIEVDLAECCSQIHQDFNATWTILANLDRDSSETWTMIQACCDQTQEDFNATWTMIQNCCNEISNDFNGTWTILAEFASAATVGFEIIVSAIEACCAQTQSSFRDTWTILDTIEQELLLCCSQNRVDFANTWTMIQNCCDEISRDFVGTWTILADLSPCGATPIPGGPSFAITAPGTYCLAGDITGTITITASKVTLDLNGYTAGRITVPGAALVNDVIIKNGFVGTGGGAIAIDLGGGTNYQIDHVDFKDSGLGLSANGIRHLNVTNATFRNHTTVMTVATCRNCVFKDILAESNTTTGTLINILGASRDCTFENVSLNNNTALIGWLIIGGTDLISTNCQVNRNTVTSGSDFTGWLLSNLGDCFFTNCYVDSNTQNGTGGLMGFSATVCTNLIFESCYANLNTVGVSSGSELDGFFFGGDGGSRDITLTNCYANENINNGTGDLNGMLFEGCHKVTLNKCYTQDNEVNGPASVLTGIGATGLCLDMFFADCQACENVSTSTAYGFNIVNSNNFVFERCIANANSAAVDVHGWSLNTVRQAYWRDCHADTNAGGTGGTNGYKAVISNNLVFNDCSANANTVSADSVADLNGFSFGGSDDMQRCIDITMNNCYANENLNSGDGNLNGIFFGEQCQTAALTHCTANQNRSLGVSSTLSGMFGQGIAYMSFTDCEASVNTGSNIVRGFNLAFSFGSGEVLYDRCIANANTAPEVVGFYANGVNSVSYEHCIADLNFTGNLGFEGIQERSRAPNDAFGFNIISAAVISIIESQANRNGVNGGNGKGIIIAECSGVTIRANRTEFNTMNGIELTVSDAYVIDSNVVLSNRNDGILISDSASGKVTSNIVESNGLPETPAGNGIELVATSSCIIEKNNVINNAVDGILLDTCSQCIVQKNVLEANGVNGIEVTPLVPDGFNAFLSNRVQGVFSATDANNYAGFGAPGVPFTLLVAKLNTLTNIFTPTAITGLQSPFQNLSITTLP
jgi:parallel beta-helix repeat protein